MYNLAIQIVNFNTKKYLKDCLEDVLKDLKSSTLTYQINVLDNHSADDLTDLEKFYKKQINFFYSDKNLGFGAGHNLLAKKVSASNLLILNPDIRIIEPRTIERLVEAFKTDPKIKVTGPELLTEKMTAQSWDHGEFNGLPAWIASSIGSSYWKKQSHVSEVAWIAGTVFLVDKKIFDKIGGFDEDYFLYREDEDLCQRIRNLGGVVLYNPNIKVLHFGGVVAKKAEHVNKSIEIFIKKNYKNSLVRNILIPLNKFLQFLSFTN